jgi:topoisomerase-4 subunit A
VRLYADMEQDTVVVAAMAFAGGRKFLVASKTGNGFIVAEDECTATTRKGKTVLNLKADEARALTVVNGELVASVGENRKMLIFPIADVPEMNRGRGVRLQRYKEKGLSDVTTFKADGGLTWTDSAGRAFTLEMKELRDWRGKRADAGRIAPKGFPKNNKFASLVMAKNGKGDDKADEG